MAELCLVRASCPVYGTLTVCVVHPDADSASTYAIHTHIPAIVAHDVVSLGHRVRARAISTTVWEEGEEGEESRKH